MSEFFGIRLSRHLKKMMGYMRYVLNDHFILVCIFLLGGLGFYYSQLLKTLPQHFIWGRPLVIILWVFSLHMGRLATLVEEADKVFILPKEKQMAGYLNRALRYSSWLPLVTLVLVSGISMPLVVVSTGWQFTSFFYYVLMLFCLKIAHLFILKIDLYQLAENTYKLYYLIWLIVSIIISIVGLYGAPWLGLLGAFLMLVIFYVAVQKKESSASLDWEKMIREENNRMHRIYQFIHLFTDVPEISSSVKRRKWVDPLISKIKKIHDHTYFYLYVRNFVRDSDYSGLFIRLVIVAGVILFFLKEFWVSLGVSVVFIYLIGFQLIPIYSQFDYMIMTRLYPVATQQKKQAVKQLVTILLFCATLLFSIFVLTALPNKQESFLIIGALVIEVIVFTKGYLPYRLKKLED